MRILVLVGGSNVPSNSEFLADAFADGMRDAGATVEKITLRDLHIDPFTIACYDAGYQEEPDFVTLRTSIQRADGIVIATPVWNFGIPGNLKNAIDRFGSFSLDTERRMRGQWNDKPFFLLFTGGSPFAAWRGLLKRTTSGVHVALEYFGGAYAGTHFEPKCTPGKGRFELVVDKRDASISTVHKKGFDFATLVRRHVDTGTLPLGMLLTRKFYALGQKIQRKLF